MIFVFVSYRQASVSYDCSAVGLQPTNIVRVKNQHTSVSDVTIYNSLKINTNGRGKKKDFRTKE